MAIFNYRRFYSLFKAFWRRIFFFWRYFTAGLYSVLGYARKSLTWRKSSGGRQDDGEERPAEGDSEAAAGTREVDPEGWETDPRELSTYE